jgi:hypothetical protein
VVASIRDRRANEAVWRNDLRQFAPAERSIRRNTQDAAGAWFEENDPEDVAFEYDVLE